MQLFFLLIAIALTSIAPAHAVRVGTEHHVQPSFEDVDALFEYFKRKFGRKYANPVQESLHFEHFQRNVERIVQLRKQNPAADFNLTGMTDIPVEEFLRRKTGLRVDPNRSMNRSLIKKGPETSVLGIPTDTLPPSINWVKHGAVNPIRDQMACGSCWAFATVSVAESQWFLKHKTLVQLSEQMLVSCNTAADGCHGAEIDYELDFIVSNFNGAISSNKLYPYASFLSYNPPCDTSLITPGAVISGYHKLDQDENVMAQWVAHNGPLIVGVDATDLPHYTGGIITNATSSQMDHAVTLVGYDMESESGQPYWIIRNSWGLHWGEDGYFRVAYGINMLLVSELPIALNVSDTQNL